MVHIEHINYGPVTSMLRTKKVKNQEDEARDIAEDVIDFLEIEEYRFSYILISTLRNSKKN
ncbi:MAG: hypothetical protein ACJ0GJ_04245 [Candidatus Actinomarina sp.]